MDQQVVGALILGAFAVAGWWATLDVVGWYRRIAPTLPDSRRLILYAFSIVCVIVSSAATWYGVVVTAAAAHFDTTGLRGVSWMIAVGVFLIPLFLRSVLKQIARDERIEVRRRAEDRVVERAADRAEDRAATRDGE